MKTVEQFAPGRRGNNRFSFSLFALHRAPEHGRSVEK